MGGAVDRLDAQPQAAPGEFLTGQLEGRHQGGLAGDQAGQGGALAVVKAEDGQFGAEAAFGFALALATPGLWGAIQGGHPQHQPAEQADAAGTSLTLAKGPVGLFYFFWASAAQAGCAAAWARRLAAQRSASCRKARWI